MWKENLKTIFVLVAGLVGAVGAVSVAPLYFESLGASADINAESQQQYWEDLMKYKLWGTTGLTFNKEKVHIADVNGYNGTATGDISFFNGQHHVGGPLLAGGNLRLADNGTSPKNDTLAGGPVRVLGMVSIADYAAQQSDASISGSLYDGPVCAMGGFTTRTSQTWDYTLRVWASTVTDGIYGHKVVAGTAEDYDSTAVVDDVTSYYKYEPYTVSIGNQPYTIAVGNYKQCPDYVPQVDTHLVVPIWPEPAEWSAGISMTQGYTEKAYIHVPPDSVYTNEYGTYDLYIENIYMSNSPNKYLYVVMPPGGRLTRIFVRDGINIQPSANSAVIQVVYVDENATFDRATNQWDTSVLVDSNLVTNKKYAGNLMFYTNKDISWNSMISPSYQGTFMTTGTFTIKDHFTLAGQLVANKLVFESDITGDFRYVPFDPPILNIDPELLENGAFPENGSDAEIRISLDDRTNTSVDFNFCFDLEDAASTAVREDFNSTAEAPFPVCVVHDTTWNYTYDEDGVTKLDSTVANVDVVRDSGYVKILAGNLTPLDENKAYLNVKLDGLVEGVEFLKMNIFNLAGAVLPGNKREGSFTLKIIDATNPPIVAASSVTGVEDETYSFKVSDFNFTLAKDQVFRGIFVSSVPSKGTLTYKGKNVTGKTFVPADSLADLKYRGAENGSGIPYVAFLFQAQEMNLATSGTATMTVNLVAANDAPSARASDFAVDENSAVGTKATGSFVVTDVDDTQFAYSLVGGDTAKFSIDASTGEILVKDAALDYETCSGYSVVVRIRDMSSTTSLADTLSYELTVKVRLNDVNENPTIAKQDFEVDEHKPAGEEVGTVVAGDLDTAAAFTQNQFSAVGGDTAIFAISASGVITTKQEVDYESGPKTYTLVVAVTDKADPTLVAVDTMNIVVNNVNEIPHITSTEFSVPENSENSTKIGTLVSFDIDGDTDFTYELLETSEFVTVTPSGDILVKDREKFDYETVESFTVKVKVTDPGNASSDTTITVKITDVNEKPEIKDQTLTTKEDAKVGSEVGKVVATDLDTKSSEFSHLTYSLVGESEKFIVKEDGTVILKDTLDYEKDSVYVIYVEVNDGEFADTAKVTVKVENVIEKSEVEITRAETGDSVWLMPDTLFINTTDLCIEWKEDGKLKGPDCDLDLEEGKNLVIKTFKDPSKDVPGVDTLVVFVSTAAPVVTVTKVADEESATNIFTIVEQQSKNDSSFYVNEKKNDIRVTVTDPVTDTKESFTVKVDLDTVGIPSKTFKNTLAGLVDANLTLNEKPASGLTHTPVNGDVIAVSYKETVDGKDLVLTYYTDKDGNIIENEDGVKLLNVAYVSEIGGKEVKIAYNVDAVTGEVVKSSGGYAKGGDAEASSSSSKGDGKSSSSKGDGKSSSSKGGSGDPEEFESEVVYTITYDYVDKSGNKVTVSYGVDADGEIVRDANGSLGYEISYTYVNKYGNSATQSLFIVLDEEPPVVEILYPAGGDILYDNFVEVKWTVNGVVQDTLVTQGLKKGSNSIIRFYRDKAGNVDSALVVVIMKNAKDVDISIEQPVTKSDIDKVAEYYAVNEPEEGETYAVSIYNNKTKKEVETLVGGSFEDKDGSGEAPYPGLEGHLGPTLGIETKVPTVNSLGGLATLDDLLGKDGMVALEGVDAANSEKATVEEYLEEYCTDEFAETALKDMSRANLYKTKMYVKVWIYTSLGQFVDYYSFVQDLDDPDYVNDAGILTLFFELKPDKDGNVRSETGRLYATGAYVYKTEVEMKSTLQCTLPPLSESSKNESSRMGAKRTVKEDLLKSFGYRRPTLK